MAVIPWSTIATAQPKGRFEYVFTYIWGRHDAHNHLDGPPLANAMEGEEERYLPFLESGPSPASVEVDNTGLPGAIVLVLPDYDAGIGFMANTTLRYKHSGIRKRIYRRRKSDESGTLDLTRTSGTKSVCATSPRRSPWSRPRTFRPSLRTLSTPWSTGRWRTCTSLRATPR